MRFPSLALAIGCASLVGAGIIDDVSPLYQFGKRQSSINTTSCDTNQDAPPGNLTQCGNSTLFFIWRPKARFLAPEGWMNDPQGKNSLHLANIILIIVSIGLFQRRDGSFHAGYQCHPQVNNLTRFGLVSNILYSIINGETYLNARHSQTT
jgi:hypothetical protein